MKARFWQAERHAKGVADVAYNMKMLFNQPFRLKNIVVMIFINDKGTSEKQMSLEEVS